MWDRSDMARSFDVVLEVDKSGSRADLDAMDHAQRVNVLKQLERLRDRDIFRFQELPGRRGPGGVPVLLALGDWRYVCEWDAGTPELWRFDTGRGKLTVRNILHKDLTQKLLDEVRRRSRE